MPAGLEGVCLPSHLDRRTDHRGLMKVPIYQGRRRLQLDRRTTVDRLIADGTMARLVRSARSPAAPAGVAGLLIAPVFRPPGRGFRARSALGFDPLAMFPTPLTATAEGSRRCRRHCRRTGRRRTLQVNNIEVVYDDVILVLRGLSLDVPEGEIIALLGANGAGKSTTLKAISGLLKTEDGEVTRGAMTLAGRRSTNAPGGDRPAAASSR